MLTLGTRPGLLRPQAVGIPIAQARTHMHTIGVSDSGKSRFLSHLYTELLDAGYSATLIDPHGDLAALTYARVSARAHVRVKYLDLPAGERSGQFLPLNVLAQRYSPYTVASNIKEAFHRAWPSLSGGNAPMFDVLITSGVKVLVSNDLPLTSLYALLTEKPYRDMLLRREEDPDVIAFFHNQFDRLSARDQAQQAGAALRRAHLLTFSPLLKYSLGQDALALDFQDVLARGESLIINLASADGEARRLLGCLLTVMLEQAALARANVRADVRAHTHFLVVDEFAQFSAQSEEAFSRILSECRKFGLFLVLAHQTWSQASTRLRGALQNVGIEVAFRLGRADAQDMALILGRADPEKVKHLVDEGLERSHPLFYPLPEQWERHVQRLQDLPSRHALIRTPGGQIEEITTVEVSDPMLDTSRQEAAVLAQSFTPEERVKEFLRARRVADRPLLTRRQPLSDHDKIM